MILQFSVSPDFNADELAPWFVFNTWLQRALGEQVHLELYEDFAGLRAAAKDEKVDIVYANSFDTAELVRERGFQPVARPRQRSDEAAVVVPEASSVKQILDFSSPLRVAATDAPDVEMIGRILLEPAGLDRSTIDLVRKSSYVLVAKELLSGKAEAGLFLKASLDELSPLVRSQLRSVVTSRIYVVQHTLLLSSRLVDRRPRLLEELLHMPQVESSAKLLGELKIANGWEEATSEDAEFMIDLMNTLLD